MTKALEIEWSTRELFDLNGLLREKVLDLIPKNRNAEVKRLIELKIEIFFALV